MELVLVPHVML